MTSHSRFEAIIQGAGDVFVIADVEGIITWLGGPVETFLGRDADSLVGVNVFDLVP